MNAASPTDGQPPVFEIASFPLPVVQRLCRAGLDLFVQDEDGASLLHQFDVAEPRTYDWIVRRFAERGLIDQATHEGITALSGAVKFGDVRAVRSLLAAGASPNTVARIERYGGSRLSIPRQVMLAMVDDEADPVGVRLEILSLLERHGLRIDASVREDVEPFLEDADPRIIRWFEHRMSSGP